MMDDQEPKNASSLLDEIEELNVLEAEELQEGVAFHAFRFQASVAMESMVIRVRGSAEDLVDKLKLPRGATLTDVVDDTLRVMFDADAVDAKELQAAVSKSLGGSVADVDHDAKTRFALPKLRG